MNWFIGIIDFKPILGYNCDGDNNGLLNMYTMGVTVVVFFNLKKKLCFYKLYIYIVI